MEVIHTCTHTARH